MIAQPSIEINGHRVGPGHPVFLIAEIGHNHGGNVETAKRLITAARDAGADAVKTQVRDIDRLYTKAFRDTPYNSENAYGHTYGLHRKALELDRDDLCRLRDHAAREDIMFFATAFDPWSLETCLTLDFGALKFASGDLTNHTLLEQGARSGLPLLISTGGAGFGAVEAAWNVLDSCDATSRTALLQCTAGYPCDYADLNLNVIVTYAQAFGCVTGASLHDNGIAMSVGAVALGASVIEKHFTLDRTMKGTDHAFSLEPQGFAKMVRDIRRLEQALGDGIKKALPVEDAPIRKMSKSLYAARPLPWGHTVAPGDLKVCSPGGGIPPSMLAAVIGAKITRSLDAEEMVRESDLARTDRTRLASA